jgi:hypothetical protein
MESDVDKVALHTRHELPTQALRLHVVGSSQGTYGSRVHSRLLWSRAFSDLPFFLLEIIICISILRQFMTKTKANSIDHSAEEASQQISSVLWTRWKRTCYWTLSRGMNVVHCLKSCFFMIHIHGVLSIMSWSPKWSLSFTLPTKILHAICHLSYVCCMLCLCLLRVSFLYVFRQKFCTFFLISLTCAACSAHLALLDLMP